MAREWRYLLILLVILAPAEARTRKGARLVKEGQAAEAKKDFDKAVALYEEALATDPKDAEYRIFASKARFAAASVHVDKGQALRDQGKLDEAMKEFQQAFAIDSSSTIAEQELRRTYQMIQKAKQVPDGEPQQAVLTPAAQARKDAEDRAASLMPLPQLKPVSRQITNLKMNNQPAKVLYETVAKLAGLNVLFDPDFVSQSQGRNYSLDLTNSTVDEALDYLSILTKAYWKPITANAIFITQDQLNKRRDYEDHVTKVFYLQNVTSPQELNEIVAAVRTVVDIRRMLTYTAQMAIIMRDTADKIALGEKLILDLDKPKSEVVVDIMVMEANRTKTRSLAATILTSGKAGINLPISLRTTGTGTTANPASYALGDLGRVGTRDYSVVLPSGSIQALLDDRQTRVLQSPQIRTLDNVKGELKIGDRYPYATGSFQSGLGGVGAGISPLVQTQFQFAEVGVNVSLTPKIHGAEDVSLHVEIDVSNIRDQVDVGGLRQPVIGQRKIFEDIRLREGESSVIGGLSTLNTSRTSTGIPGLANLPGVGWLFGNQGSDRSNSELLIVLTPRIVRSPEVTEVNMRGVAAGNEGSVKVNIAPKVDAQAPNPLTPPAAAAPKSDTPAAPAAPPEPLALEFVPSSAQVRVNSPVIVTLQVRNAADLMSAPFRLKYDRAILQLSDIQRGGLMADGGQPVSFTRDLATGSVRLGRLPGSSGASGNGTLVTISFQAIGTGVTSVSIEEADFKDSKNQPVQVKPAPLSVTIQ